MWSRVDDGFYVGSRDGEFLGYIDRRGDGRFLAVDQRSHELGLFDDLRSARSSLEHSGADVEQGDA